MNTKLISINKNIASNWFWRKSTPIMIDILTDLNKIIFWKKNKPQPVTIISHKNFSFLLTIITLKINKKILSFPIFIGSIPLKQYKLLRAFLLCL